MTKIDGLIERLEKATEKDRKLDGCISNIVLNTRFDEDNTIGHPACLYYTNSLDAAMTLVPEDAEWEIGSAKLLKEYWAIVVYGDLEFKGTKAATLALTLCLAVLKARRSLENDRR